MNRQLLHLHTALIKMRIECKCVCEVVHYIDASPCAVLQCMILVVEPLMFLFLKYKKEYLR